MESIPSPAAGSSKGSTCHIFWQPWRCRVSTTPREVGHGTSGCRLKAVWAVELSQLPLARERLRPLRRRSTRRAIVSKAESDRLRRAETRLQPVFPEFRRAGHCQGLRKVVQCSRQQGEESIMDTSRRRTARYSILALSALAFSSHLLKAQADDIPGTTNRTLPELLKTIDQLIEQNRRLEDQNRLLIDQITLLRKVLAAQSTPSVVPDPSRTGMINAAMAGAVSAPAVVPSAAAPPPAT